MLFLRLGLQDVGLLGVGSVLIGRRVEQLNDGVCPRCCG